jgi:hypothetical protein
MEVAGMILPPIMLIWLAAGIGTASAAQAAYWRVVLAAARGADRRPARRRPDGAHGPAEPGRGITSPYTRHQHDPHYRAPSRSLGGGRGH